MPLFWSWFSCAQTGMIRGSVALKLHLHPCASCVSFNLLGCEATDREITKELTMQWLKRRTKICNSNETCTSKGVRSHIAKFHFRLSLDALLVNSASNEQCGPHSKIHHLYQNLMIRCHYTCTYLSAFAEYTTLWDIFYCHRVPMDG